MTEPANKRSPDHLPATATLYVISIAGGQAQAHPVVLQHRSVRPKDDMTKLRLLNATTLLGVVLARPGLAERQAIYEAWNKGHRDAWLAKHDLRLRVQL